MAYKMNGMDFGNSPVRKDTGKVANSGVTSK